MYLTAQEPAKYTLITPIDDGPFVWKSPGAPDWEPQNYDKKFHGMVPLRTALAQSYNAATARLGTDIGVEKVLDNVRRLGIERPLKPFASTLLGAVELSPPKSRRCTRRSRAAASRRRCARSRSDDAGRPAARALRCARAGDRARARVPHHRGDAGRGARRHRAGAEEHAPANEHRRQDRHHRRPARCWFAGFTGDRLAVVWVGYDDNRAARLSGAASALPIWGDLMAALQPEPLELAKPDNIEIVLIDPQSGLRADMSCPGALEIPFAGGSAPAGRAPCASELGVTVQEVKEGSAVDRLLADVSPRFLLLLLFLFRATREQSPPSLPAEPSPIRKRRSRGRGASSA